MVNSTELDMSHNPVTRWVLNLCPQISYQKVLCTLAFVAFLIYIQPSIPKSGGLFRGYHVFHKTLIAPPKCSMEFCFDYSKCSLHDGFTFYVYPWVRGGIKENASANSSVPSIVEAAEPAARVFLKLLGHPRRVKGPEKACIFIAIVETCHSGFFPQELPHWSSHGKNHLIWDLCHGTEGKGSDGRSYDLGSSMAAGVAFRSEYNHGYHVVTSHLEVRDSGRNSGGVLPKLVMPRRTLASIIIPAGDDHPRMAEIEKLLHEYPTSFSLQVISQLGGDQGLVSFGSEAHPFAGVSYNCTFGILAFPTISYEVVSSYALQIILYQLLQHGVVPVILGTHLKLPFGEVIDWSKAGLVLPSARIPEVYHILTSFSKADILTFQMNGRALYKKYLETPELVTETLLSTLRTRLGFPPPPFPVISVNNMLYFPINGSLTKQNESSSKTTTTELSSSKVDYSSISLRRYEVWNKLYQPLFLYPSTPWDPHYSSHHDFEYFPRKKINETTSARNGSGSDVRDQFTVVMLTYKRVNVLMKALKRLNGIPDLHKVVVVWNDPVPPAENLTWPQIDTSIEVILSKRNSLNNRFLPYDNIETEAILSLDDDTSLTQDQISFGFQVWKESRGRLVGFPGRYHYWDAKKSKWVYQSEYCHLTLILTGGAFFHKIYSYKYTYEMPEEIRAKVDKIMNCEDIAMNFLVAHVSQKPPVKATKKDYFHCSDCSFALSRKASHYRKRTQCINFFAEIYGYMPLRQTVYRADSVWFNNGRALKSGPPCFYSV